MIRGALIAAVAALTTAVQARAQERGTMEFGAFASAASFDNDLSLTTASGGGGRIGMFLDPRWFVEFEMAQMRASRPNGLSDANVGILASRLIVVPIRVRALSLVLGGGAGVSTETNFMHSYGVDVLLGAKIALGRNAALRLDGVVDWLANENWKTYRTARLGLSLYRHPARAARTVTPLPVLAPVVAPSPAPAPVVIALTNSTIASAPRPPLKPVAGRPKMDAEIRFALGESEVSGSAKRLLDEKVAVFRANPRMAIMLFGYRDGIGSDGYNNGIGARRSESAKQYIVARGISASRVTIASRSDRALMRRSARGEGEATSPRATFRLLIARDVISEKSR